MLRDLLAARSEWAKKGIADALNAQHRDCPQFDEAEVLAGAFIMHAYRGT